MSDLIDRQDALDAIQQRSDRVDSVHSAFWEGLIIAYSLVQDVPSAEPEQTLESAIDYLHSVGWLQEHDRILTESAEPERPKGEWVDGLPYVNSHWWVCSVCHVPAPENHTGYNFCPSCGADMRGEDGKA